MVSINTNKLRAINLGVASSKNEIDEELDIYDEEDYFFRTPRFKRSVVLEKFHIDSPPENQDPEGMPFRRLLSYECQRYIHGRADGKH